MSQSKNGVAAMEIQRHIGVTYKCAWRIAKQIRLLMRQGTDPLGGMIEADETYVGGGGVGGAVGGVVGGVGGVGGAVGGVEKNIKVWH